MQARIVGVSFAVTAGEAAYVPLGHDYAGAPQQLDRDRVLPALRPVLEDESKLKLGHHLKYDAHVLANYGIALRGQRFDSMLESYVLNSVATHHDMDSVAQRYLGVKTIHYDEVTGKGAKKITFNQVDVDRAAEYAAEDADVTCSCTWRSGRKSKRLPIAEVGLRDHRTAAGAGAVSHGTRRRAR